MPENKGDRPPIALYLSGLVILVVSGILLLYQGGEIAAQFYAPGPVHYEHRDATCVDCHKAFRGINEKGCTAGGCHTSEDLKTMDAKPAVIELHEDKQAEKCSTCHTEHQGLEGNLTLPGRGCPAMPSARTVTCPRGVTPTRILRMTDAMPAIFPPVVGRISLSAINQ